MNDQKLDEIEERRRVAATLWIGPGSFPVEFEQAVGRLQSLAKEDVPVLLAEIHKLRAVLAREDVQWASCDGCGNHYCCPSCGAQKTQFDEEGLIRPSTHGPDCCIGDALGETKAPPGPSGAE